MKWIDGSEFDYKAFSGEALCEKLALEMYGCDAALRLETPAFLQNAAAILEFDAEVNMEGFALPSVGNLNEDDFARLIFAFRAIGDEADAEILEEALRLDAQLQEQLASAEDEDALQSAFDEKTAALEEQLYLNADRDMWAMLYAYLDAQIQAL